MANYYLCKNCKRVYNSKGSIKFDPNNFNESLINYGLCSCIFESELFSLDNATSTSYYKIVYSSDRYVKLTNLKLIKALYEKTTKV